MTLEWMNCIEMYVYSKKCICIYTIHKNSTALCVH
jgi:hypothetical protein